MPIKRAQYPPRSNKGYSGKSSKLSISKFLIYLFELNESDPPDGKRLTDDDFIESVKSEFGTKSISVRKIANPNSNISLSAKRSKYNQSQPQLLSIRYDKDQQPCRNYESTVDINQLRVKAWKYGIVDPRLFTIDEIKLILIHREKDVESTMRFRLPTREVIEKFPFGSLNFATDEDSIVRTFIDTETLEIGPK